jgi:hypothetical protein
LIELRIDQCPCHRAARTIEPVLDPKTHLSSLP